MTAKHHPWARYVPAVIVIVVIVLVIWFFMLMKDVFFKPVTNAKKMVQQITVIAPPPPPPPPEQKLEEPPPPEEEEQIDEPEPVPEEIPEASDEPPPGADLGVDAEGGAGSDAFGLIGRKGGRSLLGGNGNNPFAWFTNAVQQDVLAKINDNEKIRKRAYKVKIKLWIDTATGRVKQVELANSTGDKALDQELKKTAMQVGELSERAPIEMPQPVKFYLTSRM